MVVASDESKLRGGLGLLRRRPRRQLPAWNSPSPLSNNDGSLPSGPKDIVGDTLPLFTHTHLEITASATAFSSSSNNNKNNNYTDHSSEIYIAQNCLLIPVFLAAWWYWSKQKARQCAQVLVRKIKIMNGGCVSHSTGEGPCTVMVNDLSSYILEEEEEEFEDESDETASGIEVMHRGCHKNEQRKQEPLPPPAVAPSHDVFDSWDDVQRNSTRDTSTHFVKWIHHGSKPEHNNNSGEMFVPTKHAKQGRSSLPNHLSAEQQQHSQTVRIVLVDSANRRQAYQHSSKTSALLSKPAPSFLSSDESSSSVTPLAENEQKATSSNLWNLASWITSSCGTTNKEYEEEGESSSDTVGSRWQWIDDASATIASSTSFSSSFGAGAKTTTTLPAVYTPPSSSNPSCTTT